MITEFQRTLQQDRDTLWDIVKIYYPDIPDFIEGKDNNKISVKDKLSAHLKYDWVNIEFRLKGYGYIAIGISNCNQYKLFGPNVTIKQMEEALKDGTCKFRVWEFSLGKNFNLKEKETQKCNEAVNLLKEKGYKLQSPSEMYNIYYND